MIIAILSYLLMFYAYRYVRHRIDEKRNDELNRSIRRISEKSKKAARKVKVVRDQLDVDLKNVSSGVHPIGDIRSLKRQPKDGDVGYMNGRDYFYYNGAWQEMSQLI